MSPTFKLNRLTSAILLATVATSAYAQDNTVTADDSNVTELDTVFASASSVETDVRDAPASVSVITREELDRKPNASIAEVLGTLPGVTGGFAPTGAGSKIAFRGMPDKYTLILIDGKRIGGSNLLGHRPDTLAQDLDWLSPDAIERIEVVRGAMSTLYGSEAMGGVINIITRKIDTVWSGSLTSNLSVPDSGTSGETMSHSFNISGPITESLGIRLGGSYSDRAPDTGDRGSSGATNQNLNAKLSWQLNENHSIYLDGSVGRNRAEPFPNLAEREANGETYEVFGTDMRHKNFGIGHEGRFGEVRTKLDLYVNTYENKGDGEQLGAKSKEQVADFKVDFPVTTYGIDHWLTVGAQYKKEEVENPSNIGNILSVLLPGGDTVSAEKKPTGWAWSLFVEDQIFLKDNLILTLGLRGDKSDEFDLHISPRGYLVYHPTDSWTIKGGVSKGFRAPNLKERSLTSGTSSMGMGCTSLRPLGYTGGQCYMIGNPNLEPEVSTNYEIGVAFNQAGYSFDLTYFQSKIKDMIQNGFLGQIGGVWYTQQFNIEEGETAGLEASFGLPLADRLKLSGNATYMIKSKNKTTGSWLNMTPRWTANAMLNWEATEKLSTYASVQYIGKQLYSLPADSTAADRFAHANTTLDIGATYAVNKNLTIRAGIQNLANNIARTDDDYGDGNGRTYYMGLTARF
ncbi:MAG: TonB-dependent receptor [Alcaligenaceae bacterium]|nr:TonB-dependent receptor [Alcaligenaceae bacterium]